MEKEPQHEKQSKWERLKALGAAAVFGAVSAVSGALTANAIAESGFSNGPGIVIGAAATVGFAAAMVKTVRETFPRRDEPSRLRDHLSADSAVAGGMAVMGGLALGYSAKLAEAGAAASEIALPATLGLYATGMAVVAWRYHNREEE